MAKPWVRGIGKIAVAAIAVVVAATEERARRWVERFGRTAITIAIIAALALLWAIWLLWSRLAPPLDIEMILAVAIVAAALLAAIWWLWWRLPQCQVARLALKIRDPKARADTEDNFRKTVGQALGGGAVLIGAAVAYLQFTQQQQATRDQLQASHELLISNQVSKGFEQLAGKDMAMRLGGIYALEGVMNTSPEYHQPVLEALCAFVRDSTTRQKGPLMALLQALVAAPPSGTCGNLGDKPRPTADLQAALTVIGRRTSGAGYVDLSGVHIPKAGLGAADLGLADLSGADLSGTDLIKANLAGATLINSHVCGANLIEADLKEAKLSGAELIGVNLNGAVLSRSDLTGADLSGADLSGNISGGRDLPVVHHRRVKPALLNGTNLSKANLSGANLSDASLSGARNLTQEQLDKACGKPAALPPGLTLDKPCPQSPGAQ